MIGAGRAVGSVGSLTTGAATAPNSVVKFADALVFAFSVSVQVGAIPLHAPPQPARPQAFAGVAERVTCAPRAKRALQVVPQSMPAGELVTIPLPDFVTDSVYAVAICSLNTTPHPLALYRTLQ
jgi:hypothetical protein